MHRFIPLFASSRTLLIRQPSLHNQYACVSRLAPPKSFKERETCPQPPPPPPPPPKDDRLLWGTLAVAVVTAVFAVYAKDNPELRDWLSINASWFDDLIAIGFQENMTYGELGKKLINDAKEFIEGCEDTNAPKPCAMGPEGKTVPVIIVPEEPKAPVVCKDAKGEDDEDSPCDTLPPPLQVKNICELENCLTDLGLSTLNNYLTARDACIYYNKLVNDTIADFNLQKAKELHAAQEEKEELVKNHVSKAEAAYSKIQDIKRYFDCGVTGTKEQHAKTRQAVKDYEDRIQAMKLQYIWENDLSLALVAQYQQLETSLEKFVNENETMFSGTKFGAAKPALTGDPDLFLYHSYRYLMKLRAETKEASPGMTERVDRAMDTLPKDETSSKRHKAMIDTEYAKRKAAMLKDYEKRFEDQKAANEKHYKDAIRKQAQRHEESLKAKLMQKEKETKAKLCKMVADAVAAQKKILAKQLSDMAAKLKLVEDKLNARLKAEKETRRSQELYTAGASLLAATKKGQSIIRVDKELKAIKKAAGGEDKLVLSVLKAIPKNVWDEGVVPESKLRERYHVMERVALQVALVETEGAPLPVYAVSWLQSVFLFMKLKTIPQAEIDKTPTEPFVGLDTFDLLQRARYYMERGNLGMAVRYVNSLEGASRGVASTWYEAARALLETRQAAEAVLAHAAALGLQYV